MLKKDLNLYVTEALKENEINKLNSDAMLNIGKLDGITSDFIFLELFHILISMKEAKKSSEIEGIRTTYDDLIDFYNKKDNEKSKLEEVYGCFAILNLFYKDWPSIITKQAMFKIQTVLRNFNCDRVRRNPFLRIVDQNNETVYKPVETEEEILFELDKLEKFINIDQDYPLIKLGIFHYQFESIHPFDDGNGRTGRILNIMYLLICGLIAKPIFAMSDYIYTNKKTYYELLQAVNKDDKNIVKFIIFMMTAIKDSSIKALNVVKLINEANTKIINQTEMITWLNKERIIPLINKMSFDINDFMNTIWISRPTASKYIKLLVDNNLLIKLKSNKKCFYIWKEIYMIFNVLDN